MKWTYPSLLQGSDLLRAIIEGGLTEHVERRSAAIRAFLRDQFRADREVKFKQVELQNRLLDLFVDVPISARVGQSGRIANLQMWTLHTVARTIDSSKHVIDEVGSEAETFFRRERPLVGAATLFLSPLIQAHVPRAVIEGAPGQGKSTITQYICQVHRMRLLNEVGDLPRLPKHHQEAPVRVPFKVDLRDLAAWLQRKNPFSAEREDVPAGEWHKSLEAFLSAQVRHHSGGTQFDVDDLLAVTRLSAVLLVFDGLDEVADIARRRDVVEEVVRGITRLEENSASLQAIVTSRPAAFANSPGLPSEQFPHYTLESLPRPLIEQYATRWLHARRIDSREGAEFNRVLKDKLDQPHLRDLARNPMQLAILLSLILTRGASLPDKRTALYDNYIELFFSREAEKSTIVRKYRDLLIDIHRYLAWVLHSDAELGEGSGSVSTQRLQVLVQQYLEEQGHDPALVTTLFTGMVERVVALVSRVEGTFEFEVQPLREYFTARYLYETAPYSPTGLERSGSLPDRFNAIARNFYWLNVARFYGGCYSKGELPSLIESLQELIASEGFRLTSHPRMLASMLLSDWVFSQHPKSVKQVVQIVVDGIGLRFLLPLNRRAASSAPLILPSGCGRDELLAHCSSVLESLPSEDYASGIIELMSANATPMELGGFFASQLERSNGSVRTRWMQHSLQAAVLPSVAALPLDRVIRFMADAPHDPTRLALLMRAKRFDYIETSKETFTAALESALSGELPVRFTRANHPIEILAQLLDPSRYSLAFLNPHPLPLHELWIQQGYSYRASAERFPSKYASEAPLSLAIVAEEQSLRLAREWATSLAPWDALVEHLREIYGRPWSAFLIAATSGGIRSHVETCADYPDLFEEDAPLCRRARYARLRAGTPQWWARQFRAGSRIPLIQAFCAFYS